MSNVLTTYTLDASQPQAELEKYRRGVIALTSEEEKALIKASATAKQRKADLASEEKQLRKLLQLRKDTNNPNIIKQYDEQIKKTVDNIQRLNKETRATGREIEKVSKETKKLGGVQGTLVNQLKRVGAAAIAAFSVRAIANFAKESLKAYDVQVKAEAELLRALGNRSALQQRLIVQAKERQRVTLFDDGETVRAQAIIAAFAKEESAIKRLTIVSQDFATAKGKGLAEAAELVTKTFASSTNSLTRYGIEVEGAAGSTERLNSLTKSLDAAFSGAAETAAKTGTGPITQLKNRVGDLSETIGGVLTPAVNKSANALGLWAMAADEFIKTIQTGFDFQEREGIVETLDEITSGARTAIAQLTGEFDIEKSTGFTNYIKRQKELGFEYENLTEAAKEYVLAEIETRERIIDRSNATKENIEANKQAIPILKEYLEQLNNPDLLKSVKGLNTIKDLQTEIADETAILNEKLERGSQAYFEQAAKVDGLRKKLEALQNPFKAAREAEEAARKEREAAEKAIDGLIQGLEKQRDQLTMTNEEILRNELVQLGANEATIFSTLLLREQVEELKRVEAEKKAQIALGEQLTASVLTDAEKEKMAIEEVNEAYANGSISFETLLRKREQIQAESDERQEKALQDERKRQEDRIKLAEELVNEFGKTSKQLFDDTVDAVKDQAAALLESGQITLEQYLAILQGIQARIDEFSAITAQNVASDLSGAVDSFKEFLTILGEDSAKFVEFQKVLTGIQIALDTAKAIAGVIAAASSTSLTPIEQAAKIVAGLAIVAVNMAKAKQLFSSAGDAPAPTYAKGGYTGTGIGKRDHTGETVAGVVHAKEFVINKGETAKYKPMLEAINKGKWPEYFAQHYAPFAAIDARPNKAADKGFAANIAKALQIEFDDKLEGALKRIERKTGTTKVTNLHELGKYFKRNYWGPNTKGN